MKYYILFLTVFIFSVGDVFAQGALTTYTSTRKVIDIAFQDEYIWCITEGGVVKWNLNDHSYEKYTIDDGLPENQIESIFVCDDGSVLAVSEKYILKFENESWKQYMVIDEIEVDGRDKNPGKITIAPDGTIYGGASYRFDGKEWSMLTDNEGERYRNITAFDIDSNGNVWLGTLTGKLIKYDGISSVEYPFPETEGTVKINRLGITTNGIVWCRVDINGTDEIHLFDGDSWEFFMDTNNVLRYNQFTFVLDDNGVGWFPKFSETDITNEEIYSFDSKEILKISDPSQFENTSTNALKISPDGSLWVCSDNGLYRYKDYIWSTFIITNEIKSQWVADLTIGPQDIIVEAWGGHIGWGVSYYTDFEWKSFQISAWESGNQILSLAMSEMGEIWVGAENGVYRYADNVLTHYDFRHVFAIEPDFIEGELIVTSSGVYVLNDETWSLYASYEGLPGADYQVIPYPVVIGSDGDIWCEISGPGLYHYNGAGWEVYTVADGMASDDIGAIALGKDNDIWVGSRDGFVMRYDGNTWMELPKYEGITSSIFEIAIDSDGGVWCGTNSEGIFYYENNTWSQFTTADGLVDNWIRNMAFDSQGMLWIATARGISKLDPSMITDIKAPEVLPSEISILGAYPNPFNTQTVLSYILPKPSSLSLNVYSITGQKVAELHNGRMDAGMHQVVFDGLNLGSGIYFYRFVTDGFEQSGKMTLLK